MTINFVQTFDAGVVNISARHWTQNPDVQPGEGLITAYLVAQDNAYDINIKNFLEETFYQYWYTWSTPGGISQEDTLYTQIYGTFGTGEGNDTISVDVDPPAMQTQFQSSYILAGPDDDIIYAPNVIEDNALNAYGGSGNDSISGTWQDDLLYGDEADYFVFWPTTTGFIAAAYDTIGDGNDTINGLVGNDTIVGGGGDDILSGGQGNDLISAVSGSNQFFGGDGADTITGGTGSDFLYGGPRGTGYLDVLSGGGGADVFMLSYTETSNDGSAFWGKYFEGSLGTITGGSVKSGLANIFKDGSEAVSTGFAAAALGAIGQVVVTSFLSWIENLGPSATPAEDVLVVRDFDPSQDLLVLPIGTGVTLGESVYFYNPDAAGDSGYGLKFTDGTSNRVYAEVTLGDAFLASVGLTQEDQGAVQLILNFILALSTTIDQQGNFSSLSNVSSQLVDGGYTPPSHADLPSDVAVRMFGAIGGLIYHSPSDDYDNAFIVGTQYADVLTLNPVIQELSTLTNNAGVFTSTQSEVHGLGGDDVIYGGLAADILRGGDGNDTIYSFLTDGTGEDLSGGAGDDVLIGGGSYGIFAGGDGSDTFGVFYGNVLAPMQLFVDLTTGQAGERVPPQFDDFLAPVGAAPPFTPAAENTYALTGFENVIGGTLNDWIRMTAGGTVEGGAGADYIDATAGSVTFSYAGSTGGVLVQLHATGATVSGGDAEGDVLNYQGNTPLGLIGSAEADTLGGFSSNGFTFTGGTGADTFQILAAVPSSAAIAYTITDFSLEDGDLIDLRLIGATRDQFQILDGGIIVTNPGGVTATIRIILEDVSGPIFPTNVLYAEAVSGANHTAPGGGALAGSGGRDQLLGDAGADYLFGKGGHDLIIGGGGADVLDGGSGNDWLRGDDGNDRLAGGDGNDTLMGGTGDDVVSGGSGHDQMWGGTGNDLLQAGAGDDWVSGGDGDDMVGGGTGNDSIWAGAGNDNVLAGAGNDWVVGGAGDDILAGAAGNDSLWGGDGNDRILAGEGNDLLSGGSGDDVMLGGAANDRMLGGDGRDVMYGEAGNDLMFGGLGADWVIGGAGNDTLHGDAGDDVIDGGAGVDVMSGGAGADVFRFAFGTSAGDVVLDFNAAEGDRLVVRSDRPIAISDLGDGGFSFTDGVVVETLHIAGATLADFDLLIV